MKLNSSSGHDIVLFAAPVPAVAPALGAVLDPVMTVADSVPTFISPVDPSTLGLPQRIEISDESQPQTVAFSKILDQKIEQEQTQTQETPVTLWAVESSSPIQLHPSQPTQLVHVDEPDHEVLAPQNLSENPSKVSEIDNDSHLPFVLDFSSSPSVLCECRSDFSSPLPVSVHPSQCSSQDQRIGGNFLKGCKWSPDGLCLLSNSEDNCLRMFELPTRFLTHSEEEKEQKSEENKPLLKSILNMKEAETVFDFCW